MIALNEPGCRAMTEVGVSAATDVTGFGLVGHAFEVAQASHVTIVLDALAVPLLARTIELASQGIVTRAHKGTQSHLGDRLDTGHADPVLSTCCADAQTSGGWRHFVPPAVGCPADNPVPCGAQRCGDRRGARAGSLCDPFPLTGAGENHILATVGIGPRSFR